MNLNLINPKKHNKNIVLVPTYKRISLDYPILVRKEVAKKLAAVAKELPNKLKLQIDDG